MGTPYRVYYIQPSLASSNMLVGREEELYTHLRGAFSKGYDCKDSDNFDKSYQKMAFFFMKAMFFRFLFVFVDF